MNYARARNPQRLLSLHFTNQQASLLTAGPEGLVLRNRKTEALFVQHLHTLARTDLRPLIIVVGGFLDGRQGHAYRIVQSWRESLRDTHDLYYREHDEGRQVRELVELYRHRGHPVTLIGHSWGGDAVVNAVALRTAAAINLLVTLDPVSRKPVPRTPPVNVHRWINVYVDYTKVCRVHPSNIIARIGGPWEAVPAATVNILAPATINHEDALGLMLVA